MNFQQDVQKNQYHLSKEKIDNKTKQKQRQYQLQWDLSTKWTQHFKVQYNKFTKVLDDLNYYQIATLKQLPHQISTTINFIVKKHGKNGYFMCFGIITENRKHMPWSGGARGDKNKQSLGYWVGPNPDKGKICLDGEVLQFWNKKYFVKENQTVRMQINPSLLSFKFINKETYYEGSLNQVWRNKKMYVFIQLYEKGQQIEVY